MNNTSLKTKNRIIAIVGKGGVGKTTIAGIIVNRMISRGNHPILVVDADPNIGLDLALGINAENSVGKIREETRKSVQNGEIVHISKQELLELKINESIVETEYFDFIAMGRPEGPGCYCYANNVLKSILSNLSHQYPYIVIDNEAGLENLSRRLVPEVDLLIIISDPSNQGLRTVQRLADLVKEMGINYKKLALIVNKLRHENSTAGFMSIKKNINANFYLEINEDSDVLGISENGQSVFTLPENNPTLQIIEKFLSDTEK